VTTQKNVLSSGGDAERKWILQRSKPGLMRDPSTWR